jgi:hypothetical protein
MNQIINADCFEILKDLPLFSNCKERIRKWHEAKEATLFDQFISL